MFSVQIRRKKCKRNEVCCEEKKDKLVIAEGIEAPTKIRSLVGKISAKIIVDRQIRPNDENSQMINNNYQHMNQ